MDDSIYVCRAENEKVKLADGVTMIGKISSDFSKVYYCKDGDLYKHVIGEEAEYIDSDVSRIYIGNDSGEFYYSTDENYKELTYMDFVCDDTYEEDKNAAFADDDYELACYRSDIRDELGGETVNELRSLYYYDGKESTLITDKFLSYDYNIADSNSVFIYGVYNVSPDNAPKFSDISLSEEYRYSEDYSEYLMDTLNTDGELYVAVGASSYPLGADVDCAFVKSDGTGVYYANNIKGKYLGDIQYLPIKGGTVGKSELYDSDVYYGHIPFDLDDDSLYYYKKYEDGQGDLYVNKHMVDSDVYSTNYSKESGKLYYLTKYDDDAQYGNLKVYAKGKTIEIDEDVCKYSTMETGNILYEKNTGEGEYIRDLYCWDGKNSVLIAEDVVSCVRVDPVMTWQTYELWKYYLFVITKATLYRLQAYGNEVASSIAPW